MDIHHRLYLQRARNDPSFRLLTGGAEHPKSEVAVRKPYRSLVSAHKTDIAQEKDKQEGSGHNT